ncbi:MAG: helix-turn-helix domain-containing protein [Thermoplasmatales archaeon]
MERLEFVSENSLPFCSLSRRYPDLKFFRWCNSAVDYLEFYGNTGSIEALDEALPDIEKSLGSKIVFKRINHGSLVVMFSCRCTVENSTISMAEESGCIWEAPLSYYQGKEQINVFSLTTSSSEKFYSLLQSIGKVSISRKKVFTTGMFRDSFLIRLSDLFGKMTELQLKSLQQSIRMGYFSVPRKGKLSDISRALGSSKSTLQEHLEKAKNKLMESIEPYLDLYMYTLEGKEKD